MHMCVCMCIYIHTHTYTHMHIYTYIGCLHYTRTHTHTHDTYACTAFIVRRDRKKDFAISLRFWRWNLVFLWFYSRSFSPWCFFLSSFFVLFQAIDRISSIFHAKAYSVLSWSRPRTAIIHFFLLSKNFGTIAFFVLSLETFRITYDTNERLNCCRIRSIWDTISI